MEDPLCDWEDARTPTQQMADYVKSDVESTLFQNFVMYEAIEQKEEEESGRNYSKIKVKIGDKNFLHLKILMPQAQGSLASLISAEEKGEQDQL